MYNLKIFKIQLTVFITISPTPPSFLVLGVFLLCCLAASLAFLELSVNVEEKDWCEIQSDLFPLRKILHWWEVDVDWVSMKTNRHPYYEVGCLENHGYFWIYTKLKWTHTIPSKRNANTQSQPPFLGFKNTNWVRKGTLPLHFALARIGSIFIRL